MAVNIQRAWRAVKKAGGNGRKKMARSLFCTRTRCIFAPLRSASKMYRHQRYRVGHRKQNMRYQGISWQAGNIMAVSAATVISANINCVRRRALSGRWAAAAAWRCRWRDARTWHGCGVVLRECAAVEEMKALAGESVASISKAGSW
jgi:hypothetical protein